MLRVASRSRGRDTTSRARQAPAWLLLALTAVLALVDAVPTLAQDPSLSNSSKNPSSFANAPKIKGPSGRVDQAKPLFLQGDELIYDTRGNSVTARGNVEIYFNDFVLTADQVTYDQSANTLTAVGNVVLREPNGNIVRAERYTLTDDFRDGFVQSLSIVGSDDTRIAAERANRREGNVTEFERGKFTPCRSDPGNPPLWCISATRIVHDQRAQTLTYQDAMFEVLGVPLLYVPYFQHADPTVKRRSGFLLPSYGASDDLGFTFEIPYYFALAPNYDFTFRPMYTSKHGVLWQGDWRHRTSLLGANGQYEMKLAAIQDGGQTGRGASAGDDGPWSGSLETRGRFSLSSWWNLGWDAIIESDDTFRRFYKLDSILQTDRVNRVYLQGLSERNYFAMTGYHFGGLLLSDTPYSESQTHPIIDWNYIVDQPVPGVGGELSMNVSAMSFSRDDGAADGRETSAINRINAEVNWRRRLTDQVGITYTPFANLRGDAYSFNDVINPQTDAELQQDTVVRGVAGAGVLTSYPWAAHSRSASHVVEPLGQVIARTARVDQKQLPNEDARSLVFDDTNLFEVDKFSGWDRIETGTRANVGLQYTFQANSGGYARLLAGQSFQLAGDNAFKDPGAVFARDRTGARIVDSNGQFVYENSFNPSSGLETGRSDYVLAAYLAPSQIFRFIGQARFDDQDLELRRSDLFAVAGYGPFSAQAIYTYTAADPTVGIEVAQQDVIGALDVRLTDRWGIRALTRYDIDDGQRLQDQFQVRYTDECFVLTASYIETSIVDATRDIEPDRTLMLRFELKYLGEFGYRVSAVDSLFGENQ